MKALSWLLKERKYYKPKSLTWWASLVPVALGSAVASEPMHEMVELTTSIRNATGDAPAYVMINAGLAGIGIRGKLGT